MSDLNEAVNSTMKLLWPRVSPVGDAEQMARTIVTQLVGLGWLGPEEAAKLTRDADFDWDPVIPSQARLLGVREVGVLHARRSDGLCGGCEQPHPCARFRAAEKGGSDA